MEQTSIILASEACDRILSDDDASSSIFTERERETEITIPPTLAFFLLSFTHNNTTARRLWYRMIWYDIIMMLSYLFYNTRRCKSTPPLALPPSMVDFKHPYGSSTTTQLLYSEACQGILILYDSPKKQKRIYDNWISAWRNASTIQSSAIFVSWATKLR